MTSFSLFSGATSYFLLALLFAGYSPFYLCSLLFSFVFLLPYSAYFGVLSNFLARFSGLASIAPLPSPSPFHYVMAKWVPVVQLAAHAKSSTLYGRTVVRSYGRTILRSYNQIFSAWWVTTFSYNYGATLELRYKNSAYYLTIHSVLKEQKPIVSWKLFF